ncbi:MAG: hypothetical protein ABSB65_16130 [Candidatus Acidiferrales bacterium]|jgi:hypothetical protein
MKPASILLILPLAFASFAFSAPTPQEPSTKEWRQTQRTDPVRGEYTRYTLVGKFLQAPSGDSTSRPSLVVDCGTYNRSHKSKFFRGTLVVGDPLKIDWVEPEEIHGIDYFPKVDVVYRLNDAKEDKEQWTPSTDKTSASFSKGSLEKMLHAHTVEITAKDKSGSPISMQFDLPDASVLEQGCEVEPHK